MFFSFWSWYIGARNFAECSLGSVWQLHITIKFVSFGLCNDIHDTCINGRCKYSSSFA